MVKPPPSTSPAVSLGAHVILGLLLDEPKSGYELVQILERSIGQFWPITKAHVYAELPRLAAAGLAEGRRVAQQGAPDKTVFSATPAGRAAFRAWLSGVDLGPPRLHHPLLLKLFFAEQLTRGAVTRLLDERADEIREALAGYRALLARSAARPSPRAWTLRYAILRLEAELSFIEELRPEAESFGAAPAETRPAKPSRAPRKAVKSSSRKRG